MPTPLWLEIAKGPIIRFALAILVLGLARLVILSVWGMIVAIRRAGDRNLPYAQVIKETLSWLFPIRRLHRARPVYSYASFMFHIGIIFGALFQGQERLCRCFGHLSILALYTQASCSGRISLSCGTARTLHDY